MRTGCASARKKSALNTCKEGVDIYVYCYTYLLKDRDIIADETCWLQAFGFRAPGFDLVGGRPGLVALQAALELRPSFAQTRPG